MEQKRNYIVFSLSVDNLIIKGSIGLKGNKVQKDLNIN